jgi:hypothetical protein
VLGGAPLNAFVYHCFDRIVIFGYLTGLSRPDQVAPNPAPYLIAEQFGTLARLFPGRIELGLGRAPGTTSSRCGLCAARRRQPKISPRVFSRYKLF